MGFKLSSPHVFILDLHVSVLAAFLHYVIITDLMLWELKIFDLPTLNSCAVTSLSSLSWCMS